MAIMNTSSIPRPPLMRLEPFKGIDLSVTPTQIDEHHSPDMLNMNIDERGSLNKRTGFERIYSTSLGAGKINGLYLFRKQDNTSVFLIAHGTNLYTQDLNGNQPVSIYSSMANNDTTFFTMNDTCYIMDGTNLLEYDGTTVSVVDPYIPTITIASGSVATGYTGYEDWNLLGNGFKETRSGDNSTTTFNMSQSNLDATLVTAKVDGVDLVENTDFTVDRVNGTITFNTPPSTGTNNIEWIAYKTYSGFADRIKNCSINTIYGGSQDTRVFITGNSNMPNYVWASGLQDPTYWPENRFYKFDDIVKGFSKQYDTLIIHKYNGLHVITYTLDNGVASFPSKPINDQVGTIASKSIQLIDNSPVSLSKEGIYSLVASNVRDERNVQHLSLNVDHKLLKESNLENAISVDFDKKYWLALNGRVYIFDYIIGEWLLYDNVNASEFIEIDGSLYFGSDSEGLVYRFKKETDPNPYNDDGVAINAYWKSKLILFHVPERLKMVERLFIGIKPNSHTSVDVYARTDKKGEEFIYTTRMDMFDFNNIDFNKFTFVTSDMPQEAGKKVKFKKINDIQFTLKNNTLDESLGILSVAIKYRFQSEVR